MLHRIILVDDSEGEALLVKQRLHAAGLSEPIHWISSAEGAMSYLSGEGPYADRSHFPLPELVLLDLGMPDVDGYHFLRWLRGCPDLARVLVVVLTGEMDPKRIQLAYQLGANSFLAKNAGAEEFRNFVDFIRSFSRMIRSAPPAKEMTSTLPECKPVAPPPPGAEKEDGDGNGHDRNIA